MTYNLVPFAHEHLDSAVALFRESYRQERVHSPLLPTRALEIQRGSVTHYPLVLAILVWP